MSDPSPNHSFPSPCAGINRGSYLIKVGMGEGLRTLPHLSVGEAEADRECKNLGTSGGRGEKISARGFNGPVLVGTLLPTAREVRGGVSARAQALNETVRKKKMRGIYETCKRVGGRNPLALHESRCCACLARRGSSWEKSPRVPRSRGSRVPTLSWVRVGARLPRWGHGGCPGRCPCLPKGFLCLKRSRAVPGAKSPVPQPCPCLTPVGLAMVASTGRFVARAGAAARAWGKCCRSLRG